MILERLASHVSVLQKDLSVWNHSQAEIVSPLQKLGLEKEWLSKFVQRAEDAQSSTAVDHVRQQLAQLKLKMDSCDKLFIKAPDPNEHERKFLAFMQKHGGTAADHKTAIEDLAQLIRYTMQKMKVEPSSVDKDGILQAADSMASEVLQIILLYTLVTFVRNPAISNPTETDLRKQLSGILVQAEAMESAQTFVKEGLSILGVESCQQLKEDDGQAEVMEAAPEGSDHSRGRGRARPRGSRGGGKGAGKAAKRVVEPPTTAGEAKAPAVAAKRVRWRDLHH